MAQGAYRQFPGIDVDTRETYDLVIVGAGISGLAAAHFWRRALGASQKILILDNHDDFGGHAKRNEFTYQGRTFIGYGGTMGIATPYPYSYTAKSLIAELGIQVDATPRFRIGNLRESWAGNVLRQGTLRRGPARALKRPLAVAGVSRRRRCRTRQARPDPRCVRT
jgi:monoamine oxidase